MAAGGLLNSLFGPRGERSHLEFLAFRLLACTIYYVGQS
jgi:hypothetical protein